ncbi:hypothetical protein ACFLUK_02680 [Chloroflexota bacterium]
MGLAAIKKAGIDEINNVAIVTDRVQRRKGEYLTAVPRVCAERNRLIRRLREETEGQPEIIRRAKLPVKNASRFER